MGVGYVIGPRIAGVMFAGGVLSWLVLLPLLSILGNYMTVPFPPVPASGLRIDQMSAQQLWSAYIRYTGAGAVLAAGLITLARTMPTIVASFRESVKDFGAAAGAGRPAAHRARHAADGRAGRIAAAGAVPRRHAGHADAVELRRRDPDRRLRLLLRDRVVADHRPHRQLVEPDLRHDDRDADHDLHASSSPPGWLGDAYAPIALGVGAVVCIAASIAGATSQDLKTGFLVGATPVRQQIGLIIGVLTASFVIGMTTLYLHRIMVIGSTSLPAPQATLMATIIKGLLSQNLPWGLVLVGVFISVTLELCGIRSLSFAVGSYLPIATTAPIFVGGLVRWFVERKTGQARGVRDQLRHALQFRPDRRRLACGHPVCRAVRLEHHPRRRRCRRRWD